METIYITKYALSDGISEVEAEIDGGMAVVGVRYARMCYHGEGREWHRTIESAKAHAEEMRKRKIASHQKSIKKLENLKF